MSNLDDRIISLGLNDSDLQNGANRVVSTLRKLSSTLQMKDAKSGLDDVSKSAKNVDLASIQNSVNQVSEKFNTLRLVAIGALSNIAGKAVSTGASVLKSLTIAPIMDGFHEYETQMNAVQTILANTASKGSTIKDVNASLADLNTYADKTIYNFTEMTQNIGTFTAAGVDLKTSSESIKGIANLAAVSGSNSQQASTAMYQLSQAIASGTVKLMDWNSVVNAGMGGEVFQNALIRTSEHLKTGAKAAIAAKGSFRESLSEGWLTTKVLTDTLNQFQLSVDSAQDYNNTIKSLVSQGYTQQEAKAIADMAKTAGDAATKVKTFSQLMDTLKEAVGSGWTNTFQNIFGDFEEARESWTSLSLILGKLVSDSANARNDIIKGWGDLGGRKELFGSLTDSISMVLSYLTPLKEGFHDIFPAITSQQLFNLTKGFHDFVKAITLSSDQMHRLRTAVADILSPLGLVRDAISYVFSKLMPHVIPSSVKSIDLFISALQIVGKVIRTVTEVVRAFGTGITKGFGSLSPIIGIIKHITSAVSDFVSQLAKSAGSFDFLTVLEHAISTAGEKIGAALGTIKNVVTKAFSWIGSNVSISLGDVFKVAAGGGVLAILKKVYDLIKNVGGIVDKVKDLFTGGKETLEDAKKSASIFKTILNEVSDSLKAFTQGIKAGTLLMIAGAIGILAYSLKTISEIDIQKTVTSLVAMAAMFGMLSKGLKSITAILTGFSGKGLIQAGITLLLLATAINKLADAMKKIAELDIQGIAKGLIAIKVLIGSLAKFLTRTDLVVSSLKSGVMLIALAKAIQMLSSALSTLASLSWEGIGKGLSGAIGMMISLGAVLKLMSGTRVGLTTSFAMLAMAYSLVKLGNVMVQLSALSWDGIEKGLVGIIGVMGTMALVMKSLAKNNGTQSLVGSISMLILAQTLTSIGKALTQVSMLSWDSIEKGLAGIVGALTTMTLAMKSLAKNNGFSNLAGALSMVIMAQTLSKIGDALLEVAKLSWEEIGKGLTGVVTTLGIMKSVLKSLSKVDGLNGLAGAVSMVIVASTLEKIGAALQTVAKLSWDEIGQGLVAFGGVMIEMTLVMKLLGKVSGFKSLLASVDLFIVSQSLADIGSALTIVGKISWDSIKSGLVGLGGVLAEMGIVSGALGKLSGMSGLLGAASIFIAVQSLAQIADALKVVGKLSWDEIEKGLVGIGAALLELGVVSGVLGYLTNVLGLVGAASILLSVQSLSKLADALGDFASYSWDDIKKGLTAMGGALAVIAGGTFLNTLSIIGSLSIAKVAEPLGTLADSIQKWSKVKVPGELKKSLSDLASGLRHFLFTGLGSDSLAVAAPAVGKLADSVKKWEGVKFPSGLKKGLNDLAEGIQPFLLQFTSGMNLNNIVGPIGDLSSALSKWNGVKFPAGLKQGLWDLKDGIGAFSMQFTSGFNLNNIVDPISKLPDALSKWQNVKIPDGLKDKLKGISDAMGAFNLQFTSGFNLGNIVGPLTQLPEALKKWTNISIPDGFKQTLYDVKDGIGAFSLQFTSGWNLGNIVGPLGELADALKKWSTVTIPAGLKQGLWDIKNGVAAFQGQFFTGGNIDSIVGPLGSLAGAIKKWNGVSVPANFKQGMWDIKNGVAAFQGQFLTGGNIDSIVGPLGSLAGAIQKWNGVSVPANFKQGLWDIKNGVAAFQGQFLTGGNIDSIVGPLGSLAGAIQKWNGVSVPANFKQGLWDIKNGVAAFQGQFLTGGNLDSIVGPLGSLAGAIQKWNGVSVPANFKQGLWDIKNGVAAFQGQFLTGGNLDSIVGPLGSLAGAIQKWNGVSVPNGLKSSLTDIAGGVKEFAGVTSGGAMTSIVQPLASLATSVSAWSAITVPDSLRSGLTAIKSGVEGFGTLGAAGSAISTIVSPLKSLATAVAQWANVQGVTTISNDLSSLKNAVSGFEVGKSFGASATTLSEGLRKIASSLAGLSGIDTAGPMAKLKTFVTDYNSLGSLNTQNMPALTTITTTLRTVMAGLSTIAWWSLDTANAGVEKLKTFVSTLASIDGSVLGSFKASISSAGDLGINAMTIAVGNATVNLSSVFTSLITILNSVSVQLSIAAQNLKTSISVGFSGMGANIFVEFSLAAAAVMAGGSAIVASLGQTAAMVNVYSAMIPLAMVMMSFGITSQMFSAQAAVVSGSSGIRNAFQGLQMVVLQFALSIPLALLPMNTGIQSALGNALQTIASYNSQYYAHGKALMDNLVNGVRTGGGNLAGAATQHLAGAVSELRGYYGGFFDAGQYVAEGFANGISAGSNAAISAAASMGAQAIAAAKAATDEHSPSKKAFKIGHFVGEGMANGETESIGLVTDAATTMGEQALGSLKDAMKNSGTSMSPTVSPIYDMTGFKRDTNSISSMMANSGVSLLKGHISIPDVKYVDPRVTALASYQNQMVDTNSRMISKLDSLNDNMAEYQKAIENQELGVYMDGDKVASKLAKPMNQKLGTFSRRGEVR
jgi:tape measure domain-containing protein